MKVAARLWLQACNANGRERGTVRTYEQDVRLYIVPHLGRMKLSRLSKPMIAAFRNTLLAETSGHRARKVMSALRLILKEMEETGLVVRNVAAGVRIERPNDEERALEVGVDVPTPAEAGIMLRHAKGRDRPRLVLALFTGLRASEMRGLRWTDIDLSGNSLTVRERVDWWGNMGNPKSKRDQRAVPLIRLVVNALKKWRLAAPPDNELVFPGRDGGPISHSALIVALDCLQRAPPGSSEPMARRNTRRTSCATSSASWMIDRGPNPKELQELMGTTVRRGRSIFTGTGSVTTIRSRRA